MCTRFTGGIDDMNATHTTGAALPRSEWSQLAYNLMINRADRAKRVVVRRDCAFGMKPVKFTFRPTINKFVGLARQQNQNQFEDPALANVYVKRVLAPWIPFYRYTRYYDTAAAETKTYLDPYVDIPHFGLAIAMRPQSCTNGILPLFNTKTYFDIEFKGPRLAGSATVTSLGTGSYQLFNDTLGDGTIA